MGRLDLLSKMMIPAYILFKLVLVANSNITIKTTYITGMKTLILEHITSKRFMHATCCTPEMKIKIKDVAGNLAEHPAFWDGTGGGGLDTKTIYYIVGGVVGGVILLALIAVIIWAVNRKYSAVSTDGN